MADIKDCLDQAVAAGHISQETAVQYLRQVDDATDDFQRAGRSYHESRKLAALNAYNQFERKLAQKRRAAGFQTRKQAEVNSRFEDNPDRPGQVGMSFLQYDRKGEVSGPNLQGRYNQIRSENGGALIDMINEFRSRWGGLTEVGGRSKSQEAALEDIVRELHGEKTGNAEAAKFAQDYTARRNQLTNRFNRGGGDIQKRKRWALPQKHNRDAIRNAFGKVDKAELKRLWVEFVHGRAFMYHPDGSIMSPRELRKALEEVYDDIMTGGMSRAGNRVDGSPVNKRVAGREIHFNDAKAWLEYNSKFSREDLFTVLLADLDNLARDVATIEVLGPYPDATIRHIKNKVAESHAEAEAGGSPVKRASVVTKDEPGMIERMWDVWSGRLDDPVSEALANAGTANRAVQSGALLGGAFFSSFSDAGTVIANSRFNNLPIMRLAKEWFGQISPTRKEDRQLAAKLGFIADTWLNNSQAAMRMTGQGLDLSKGSKLRRGINIASDFVMRSSGLAAWTDAARNSFRLTFLGELTSWARKGAKGASWDSLPANIKQTFARYGITEDDWKLFKSTEAWYDPKTGETSKAEFIRPGDVYEKALKRQSVTAAELRARFEAAAKFYEMIDAETYRAVIIPDLRSRAALSFGTKAGTPSGEAVRAFALFKTFPVALLGIQGARIMGQGTAASRGKYLATAATLMLVAAAMGEQASQISKGAQPFNWDDPTFWGRVMFRAGFFGLVGDFLGNAASGQLDKALFDLMGPVAGQFEKTVYDPLFDLVAKKDTRADAGHKLVQALKHFIPGQSLWYGRVAFERLFLDNLEELIDGPDAKKRWRDAEKKMRKDQHRGFWWKRGESALT